MKKQKNKTQNPFKKVDMTRALDCKDLKCVYREAFPYLCCNKKKEK